jgi:hypothetical protein
VEVFAVKIFGGFLFGIMTSGLLFWGMQFALPIQAQSDNTDETSDNFSLVDLVPDIEKIYRDALTEPFVEAEKKIYDEDIAQYYHMLLEKTILDEPEN